MKKIILFLVFAGTLTSFLSCKKSLIELQSQSNYDYNSYFANSDALNQATIATYATLLHDGLWSREYYFIFDLMGYEAKRTTNMQGDLAQLATYTFGTNQPQLGQLWGSLYRMIFRANVVIDRVNAWNPSVVADQQSAKQYVAEAKFLRAYSYFNLVALWGKVPLITSYDSTLATDYPQRAATADVWAFVEKDLTDAATNLPVTYPTTQLGRATRGAANSLLGRVYMFEKKWAAAQTILSTVVSSATYSLDPSYDNLFGVNNQNSPENIFQVMNQQWTDWGIGNQYYVFGGQETWGGKATHSDRAQEYGFKDWWNVYVSTVTVNAFHYTNPVTSTAYTDPRAFSTFYGTKASGGDTVYCRQCVLGTNGAPATGTLPFSYPFNAADAQGDYSWKKYEYYDQVFSYGGPQSGINGQVIRYADVLLMLAEAYIQQGNTGGQPLALINQVRARSGAFAYIALGNQTNATSIIMRERQLEFAGEQSRYFDLLRWGILKQTENSERAAEPGDGTQPFLDKHLLFPIPDVEKNYNPNAAVTNGWN
jgi:starch-binding outer membrane protein, SusD/RagB family